MVAVLLQQQRTTMLVERWAWTTASRRVDSDWRGWLVRRKGLDADEEQRLRQGMTSRALSIRLRLLLPLEFSQAVAQVSR
ncbi:hypothetical protein Scep_002255 [Stephania cephalantha]|uniref:Uncharacterized protein n=1 Tax=Stephania cephalantha TaxID=152367 RepID=A0AAP0Q5T1_9MAGN